MNTSGKVFLGVVAGAAAGAALGILFAPDKGSNTRKKIVEGANSQATALADKFNGYVDRMSKGLEEAKDELGHLVDTGKAKVDVAKEEATSQYDKSRTADTERKIAGSYK